MELPKNYEPQSFETEIYSNWESSGYFRPEVDRTEQYHSGHNHTS